MNHILRVSLVDYYPTPQTTDQILNKLWINKRCHLHLKWNHHKEGFCYGFWFTLLTRIHFINQQHDCCDCYKLRVGAVHTHKTGNAQINVRNETQGLRLLLRLETWHFKQNLKTKGYINSLSTSWWHRCILPPAVHLYLCIIRSNS